MNNGKLYAVGVGPGDPDLLTLRAVKILRSVDLAFAAASPANEDSTAYEIAKAHLRPDAPVIRLEFPMTRKRDVLERAWREAARTVAANLKPGLSAAFLTLGDPTIYSTFAYLSRALRELENPPEIEISPGVSSFQAVAARAGVSLCEGDETLALIAGTNPEDKLTKLLELDATVAIFKVYRNAAAVRAALAASGRADSAILASFVGRDGESVGPLTENKPPYMSMIISEKIRD